MVSPSYFWQLHNATAIGVGFGTAGLGGNTYPVVNLALQNGFRKFDTAEADWWYNQAEVGRALHDFFQDGQGSDDEAFQCTSLQISTKIPPWSLTSFEDIRTHASNSRQELVGFCDAHYQKERGTDSIVFPLDVYYIHAPRCWSGWHHRCDNPPPTLELKDAWRAMEAIVGTDGTAKRIGLSNVHPQELLEMIQWVQHRIENGESSQLAPPRLPDVLQAYSDPIHTAQELRQICDTYGIEFVSYSTLGTQHRNTAENPILTSPVVVSLAEKHGRSVAEVVLSWALQNNMSIIPRSSQKQHIEELARLLEYPSIFLDNEDLMAMDTLSSDYVEEL